MTRQTRFALNASMVLSLAATLATPLFAAPVPRGAETAKVRTIHFDIRNDSKSTMTVRDGDVEVTMAPGHTAHVKLPLGSDVIAVSGSSVQAGTRLSTVDPMLEGNTLALR